MATATQRWSDDTLTLQWNQWQATLSWDVINAPNEFDALTATVINGGTPIPVVGDAHPRSIYITCNSITPKRTGFNLWTVTAHYQTISFSGDPANPLNNKPELEVIVGSETDHIDVTPVLPSGYALIISNSAGDAFKGGVPREFATLCMRYTRNEPFFDLNKAMTYSMCTNSKSVTINGAGTAERGQMMCRCISPASPLQAGMPYVKVRYDFEFRMGTAKDASGRWNGFHARVLDQGDNGWWTRTVSGSPVTSKVKFYLQDTPPRIVTDVLLDGKGRPADVGNVTVTSSASAVPDLWPGLPLDPAIIVEEARTSAGTLRAVYLSYPRYPEIDINGLKL